MSRQPSDDDRAWAAEKRDFVADRRDELATRRETAGDARDLLADEREADLDERERQLNAHAETLGLQPHPVSEHRVAARAAREQARLRRDETRAARELAQVARDEATRLRLEVTPTTRLAAAFATIAEHLYAADSLDAVLQRIAESAVSAVAGCDMASVTVSKERQYRTAATTHEAATAVDRVQYDAQEGPAWTRWGRRSSTRRRSPTAAGRSSLPGRSSSVRIRPRPISWREKASRMPAVAER